MSEQENEGRPAKAQSFLWIVQAGLLAQAATVRRGNPNRDPTKITHYSGTGVFIHTDEAVRAAGLIPENMTAAAAAEAFCGFWATDRKERSLPHWFARHSHEKHDYSIVAKPDQFLWIVQTTVLADAENQAQADPGMKKTGFYDEGSVVRIMGEAVRVASRIPVSVDVTEAASEFLAFYSPGMKERRTPPSWCRP